jgi:hypothetical protein
MRVVFLIEKEMSIWKLETDSDNTIFTFSSEDDRMFFQEVVKDYFEESQPVQFKWKILYMLRGEPRKHPDFFEIECSGVIAISQKAADKLVDVFKDFVEMLPIETDAGRYYAINVLNFVDCLDKEKSVYNATKNDIIVDFSSLEFKEEKLAGHAIFKIPELPYCTFVSSDIQDECEANYLRGLLFETESNLIWYTEY